MKKSISLKTINLILISILLFHSTLIRFYYVNYNYNLISGVMLTIVFIYLIPKVKIIFNNNTYMNMAIFCMSLCILFSSVINQMKFAGSLITIMRINIIFWFYQYAIYKGKEKIICLLYALFAFFYLVITYGYIVIYPDKAWLSGLQFFIGSKFYVSYIALLTIICWLISMQEYIKNNILLKAITICLICFCYFIIVTVKCGTGKIGILLLLLFIALKNVLKSKLNKWNVFCVTLLIASFVFIVFSGLTSIGFISDFITNVLNKDVTMSGRTIVYAKVLSYIVKSPVWGYGYNSVYELFKNTMYLGSNAFALDAQNALLEYVLYYGLLGVSAFMLMLYFSFNKPEYKGEILDNDYFCYVGLYIMVLLGSVEITYNMIFFTFLAFVYSRKAVNERKL